MGTYVEMSFLVGITFALLFARLVLKEQCVKYFLPVEIILYSGSMMSCYFADVLWLYRTGEYAFSEISSLRFFVESMLGWYMITYAVVLGSAWLAHLQWILYRDRGGWDSTLYPPDVEPDGSKGDYPDKIENYLAYKTKDRPN